VRVLKVVDIQNINTIDLHLTGIVAMRQRWKNHGKYSYLDTIRPNHGLTLLLCEKAVYRIPDSEDIIAFRGDIIYLPKASRYEVEFYTNENKNDSLANMLINFMPYDKDGEEISFSNTISKIVTGASQYYYDMFSDTVNIFENYAKNTLKIKSNLYDILSSICTMYRNTDINSAEFKIISKGIQYLEDHFSSNKSVRELARMCCVSETCFRKLFKKYSGVSPVEYKNRIKISKAKQLLSNSELTIDEIVDFLGFYDKAYFCKMFKEKTGVTPKEYRKKSIHAKLS